MAKCNLCGKEKGSSDSCINYKIKIGGNLYEPLPYKARNKTLYERHFRVVKRCPSCGVKEGGLHHVGCIFETCPKCNRYWLSCSCFGIKVKYYPEGAKVIPFPFERRI